MRRGGGAASRQRKRKTNMQATKEQIAGELKKILVEDLFVEIPPDQIKETDSLSTDIGLDSVGQIELVSLIEEKYGLRMDASQAAAEMQTLGAAAAYVWNNVNNGAGSANVNGARIETAPGGPREKAA